MLEGQVSGGINASPCPLRGPLAPRPRLRERLQRQGCQFPRSLTSVLLLLPSLTQALWSSLYKTNAHLHHPELQWGKALVQKDWGARCRNRQGILLEMRHIWNLLQLKHVKSSLPSWLSCLIQICKEWSSALDTSNFGSCGFSQGFIMKKKVRFLAEMKCDLTDWFNSKDWFCQLQ